MSIHSVEKYINYNFTPIITMKEFSKMFKCIAWDPMIEKAIKEQHVESPDYQTFDLVRTDLLSTEDRAELFKDLPIEHS